ncbi:daptide biosynthesis RiPP recognition protein [Streptomyces sp. GESEQ-35]|uniref:daptide biosynthesis RiPP recognition protein n=1 Tax=Streptomyces sp. GESEQ-35 TaxID=2812657 RepID=UPI001B3334DA|nr:daptide biosynthesis RiPP recognition protein [Streptomyces sp. GESEQ-35]
MTPYKRHLMSWITGRGFGLRLPEQGAATVVTEDVRALERATAEGLVGPETLVFAPSGSEAPGVAAVVPYRGSLVEPGAEAQIGEDFFLQIQAYSIAGFLVLLGPTAVRLTDQEDVEAFLADADAALTEGSWPDVLTNPAVQFADVAAAGGAAPVDGPWLRLYLDSEGARAGTPGPLLGPEQLPVDAALQREVAGRTWLGRYHAAVQALQSLRARGHEGCEVSGFGVRFNSHLDTGAQAPDLALPEAPVLLRSGETYFVYEPVGGRTFEAGAEAALTLERALVQPESSEDSAAWAQARTFLERGSATAGAAA